MKALPFLLLALLLSGVAHAEMDHAVARARSHQLADDLSSSTFRVRREAEAALTAMGKAAIPALRNAHTQPKTLEQQMYAYRILNSLDPTQFLTWDTVKTSAPGALTKGPVHTTLDTLGELAIRGENGKRLRTLFEQDQNLIAKQSAALLNRNDPTRQQKLEDLEQERKQKATEILAVAAKNLSVSLKAVATPKGADPTSLYFEDGNGGRFSVSYDGQLRIRNLVPVSVAARSFLPNLLEGSLTYASIPPLRFELTRVVNLGGNENYFIWHRPSEDRDYSNIEKFVEAYLEAER